MIRDCCGCIMWFQCWVVGVLCFVFDFVSCMKGYVLLFLRCVILFIYILFFFGCLLEFESMVLYVFVLVDGCGYVVRRNCYLLFFGC